MSAFDVFFLFGLPVLILAASIIGRTILNRPKPAATPAAPFRPVSNPAVVTFDAGKFVIQTAPTE